MMNLTEREGIMREYGDLVNLLGSIYEKVLTKSRTLYFKSLLLDFGFSRGMKRYKDINV